MKNRIIVVIALVFSLVFGFSGPSAVFAATTPSLGAADTFGVLSSTFTNSNTAPQTIVNGDVGYTVAGAPITPPLTVTGLLHPADATHTQAGIDQGTALGILNGVAQACTVIAGPLNAVVIPGNAPGVFPPGCYEMASALIITLSTSITLDLTAPGGVGSTWIFKSTGGGLTTGADSFVTLANGASACNVFWAPVGAANIGAYTGALPNLNPFIGTIIDDAGIGLGHFANLSGRALAFGGTVTTDANTITVPSCAVPPPVIVVPPAPSSGGSTSGGFRSIVPPLIRVMKIPNPTSLPTPGGTVNFTYTVTNPGTVALSNVRLNDDKCGPVNFISGDTNGNGRLDTNEAWIYTCRTNLSQTTTNTVTAQGDANGMTATNSAIATVIVSIPKLPNTGYPPLETNVFVLAGILILALSSIVVYLKKRMV